MTYLAYDIDHGPIETVALSEYQELEAELKKAKKRIARLRNWTLGTFGVAALAMLMACGKRGVL